MMLQVKNIRRVGSARLPLDDRITFLAGQNKAGKTSLLTALGALLAHERAPVTGKVRDDAEHLVQRGEKTGQAVLEADDWAIHLTWRADGSSDIKTNGQPLTVGRLCAGLDTFSALDKAERLALLAKLLDANPGMSELQDACPLASEEALAKLDGQIANRLWDGAWSLADSEAKQEMGAWRQITGKVWNAKAGEEWMPDALPVVGHVDDAKQKLEELRAAVPVLGQKLRHASPLMITPQERARLEQLAQGQPVARERLQAFEQNLAELDECRAEAQVEAARVPEPGKAPKTCACPECGVVLDVTLPEKLRAAGKGLTAEERKAQDKAWKEAKAAETRAVSAYQGMLRNVESARAHLGECQNAAGRLEDLGASDGPPDAGPDREQLQAELDRTVAAGRALTQWIEAKRIHAAVAMWTELRKACAPEGLRRTALKQKLAAFNGRLAGWARDVDGLVVAIDEDMAVTGNGEPYRMLSGSEKWLTDALVMLAVAELEEAPVVVIDEANSLDERLRASFIANVLGNLANRRVVVGCAIGFEERAPALDKWGLGTTWWVREGGVEVRLSQPQAA
jgi:energy-coupling factor transporter ATP-binding protein EcfA2